METVLIIAIIAVVLLVIFIQLSVSLSQTNKIILIMSNTEQALEGLDVILAKVTKIGTESLTTLQLVKDLQEAAANNDTPQAVLDKISLVADQVKLVDDLVPDVITGGDTGNTGGTEPGGDTPGGMITEDGGITGGGTEPKLK